MNEEIDFEWLSQHIHKKYPDIKMFSADATKFCFEERVNINCFYCKNYDVNWRCPPRIPKINYQNMMCEYEYGAFIKLELPFKKENFPEIRAKSTNDLHKILLYMEKILWEHNRPMAISFIGGSCKLCKNGCGPERCNQPYSARIPFEATGVNVIKTMEEQTGVKITFPPKDKLERIGLILW